MDVEVIIGLGITIGSVILAFIKTREARLSAGSLVAFMEGFKAYEGALADGTITDAEKVQIAEHNIVVYRNIKSALKGDEE